MVGGPCAASSGGMSDVRSLEQRHPSAAGGFAKDHKSIVNATGGLLEISNAWPAYFLGSASTLADTAEFFKVPPRISGPSGVNTIPLSSARTS